jgi:tryptophanase
MDFQEKSWKSLQKRMMEDMNQQIREAAQKGSLNSRNAQAAYLVERLAELTVKVDYLLSRVPPQ